MPTDTERNSTRTDVRNALLAGFAALRAYPRMVVVFWGSGLLLALLAAWPLRAWLAAEAGDSLLLGELIAGFDYTFLNDFLQNYGSGFTLIFQQSVWLLVAQYLLLTLLVGGLVNVLWRRPDGPYLGEFWRGAGRYGWRMLRLTLFFLVLHALVLAGFVWLYLTVTKGLSPQALESEGVITSSLRWLVPLYVLVAAVPFMWQDYAKVFLVRDEPRFIWPAVGAAARFLLRCGARAYLLYVILIGLGLLVILLNYWLTSAWPVASPRGILFSFLGSQLFALARLGLKVVNQGSVCAMVGGDG